MTPSSTTHWHQAEAIELCRKLEQLTPSFGFHVALTGGTLFKEGLRKDLDLVFFVTRHWVDGERHIASRCHYSQPMLAIHVLKELGFTDLEGSGWKITGKYNGKPVDCLFPDAPAKE